MENKKLKLEHHLGRCFVKEGDRICFKRPKRKRAYGRIKHIERDIDKVTWTKGGLLPFYITVEMEAKGQYGETISVKTYESKLRLIGGTRNGTVQ